ncbi:site-2 protease family protein [Candidatus Uhrbacteria bacterium]|nr:site-2 protease family protein [Candidatus Uhrbacteria bacterium]
MLSTLFGDPLTFIFWIIAILYGLSVHECAHAVAATLLGDRTPGEQGRLTLNPLAHIDLTGLLFLFAIGFGWGKPVQFNPYNIRHQRWGPVAIAIAGPASNFISVIIFSLALKWIGPTLTADNLLIPFLQSLIVLNVVLGVFNLIPLPPLDGSRLVTALFPNQLQHVQERWEREGQFILIALLLIGMLTATSVFTPMFATVLRWVQGIFQIPLL